MIPQLDSMTSAQGGYENTSKMVSSTCIA